MCNTLTLREKVILGILAALLVAGALWRVWPHAVSPPGAFRLEEEAGSHEAALGDGVIPIVVHIVGAVQNPGVYRLSPGSRVQDLLIAAGGSAADADLEQINLARPLMDGEQVQILRIGEVPGAGRADAKVNINRATVEELATLPGIGPVRAQRIFDYRAQHGFFTDPRELMDVSGIGEGIYQNIADLITVY
ncbi:MAG: helix-hairpin-helix domain-containing protein [Bacillota bacterium]